MAALAMWAAVALVVCVLYSLFATIRGICRWFTKRRMDRGELRFLRYKFPTYL